MKYHQIPLSVAGRTRKRSAVGNLHILLPDDVTTPLHDLSHHVSNHLSGPILHYGSPEGPQQLLLDTLNRWTFLVSRSLHSGHCLRVVKKLPQSPPQLGLGKRSKCTRLIIDHYAPLLGDTLYITRQKRRVKALETVTVDGAGADR